MRKNPCVWHPRDCGKSGRHKGECGPVKKLTPSLNYIQKAARKAERWFNRNLNVAACQDIDARNCAIGDCVNETGLAEEFVSGCFDDWWQEKQNELLVEEDADVYEVKLTPKQDRICQVLVERLALGKGAMGVTLQGNRLTVRWRDSGNGNKLVGVHMVILAAGANQ